VAFVDNDKISWRQFAPDERLNARDLDGRTCVFEPIAGAHNDAEVEHAGGDEFRAATLNRKASAGEWGLDQEMMTGAQALVK